MNAAFMKETLVKIQNIASVFVRIVRKRTKSPIATKMKRGTDDIQ